MRPRSLLTGGVVNRIDLTFSLRRGKLANPLEARCAGMKIVADKAIPFVEPFFSTLGEVELLSEAELTATSVRNADCLVVRTVTRVNEELLARSRARCVASATSGTDHIDLDCLRRRGILVFDAKGCNAGAVAEYALSGLFALSADNGLELKGKIAGIIGCGNTGGRLRQLLNAIGIETRVYDPFIRDQNGSLVFQELDEVLDADIISLHVPLTTTGEHPTWRMIGRDFLKRLKTDVTFINTSRGGVADERELLRFAKRNPASRLALDVWDNEPCINQELLAAATLATPHIAGYSLDARVNATRRVYEQARDFFWFTGATAGGVFAVPRKGPSCAWTSLATTWKRRGPRCWRLMTRAGIARPCGR